MLRVSFRRTSEHDWHERLSSSNWVSLTRQGLYNTAVPSDGCSSVQSAWKTDLSDTLRRLEWSPEGLQLALSGHTETIWYLSAFRGKADMWRPRVAYRSGANDPEPTSVLQGTNWPVAKSWAYPPDWSRLS